MFVDYFIFTLKGLIRRQLRSWLTVIGILIGIAAVVSLISLSLGLQDTINEQFKKVGSNRIMISAGGVNMGPMATGLSTAKLHEDDVDVIGKVKGVELAVGMVTRNAKVKFKDQMKDIPVFGMPLDNDALNMINEIGFFDIEKGRQLKSTDKYSANIGYQLAKEGFDKEIRVGDSIYIEDQKFSVEGIQKKAGTGVHDLIIRIPKAALKELFSIDDEVSIVYATVYENEQPKAVAENIKKELRKHRDVEEGEEDFTVETSEQLVKTFKDILAIVQSVLVGIASISLLVGGVGIMNTMFTSVLERRKEIGIMKAVGAKNTSIMLLFLIESGLLGMIGGVIGVLLGIGISMFVKFLVTTYAEITLYISFSPWLIFSALLFSFVVGSVSGVMPARQAAKLRPVEALSKRV